MKGQTRREFFKTAALGAAVITTASAAIPMDVRGQEKIPFKLPQEVPPLQVRWIGAIEGSWKEMGIQYGQRCAKDIARNFDIMWRKDILNGAAPWQQRRTEEERGRYCALYLQRSARELAAFSPKLTEFMEGIGEGAQKELEKGKYADVCSNFLKILLLHHVTVEFHPDWDFSKDRPRSKQIARAYIKSAREDDCNTTWMTGKATKDGQTYASRAAQSMSLAPGGSGRERQVAYVAIPKDPTARVFWGHGRAGNLGGLGGGLLNDQGVCCLTAGAQYKDANEQPDETMAPGVKDFLLAINGVIFCKTAREAAEMATVGTPEYRQSTGRKTVLRSRGANVVFGDPKEAYVVEQNARHYAIRTPGELGEKGKNYIISANHFKRTDGSFDENNVFGKDQPMTKYCPEKERDSSYYRFWTGMWFLNKNYGMMDQELLMLDLVPAHYAYDKDGNRFDTDPQTGAPTVAGSFCSHTGKRSKENPLGTGGNVETSVFNLTTREVWWVPLWPCHYKEWNMDWNYLNINTFATYRQKVYGY